MMRTFRVAEGRVVVLPRDVLPGPGDVNLRYESGDTFALPDERIARFVRRRVEAGDLVDSAEPDDLLSERLPRREAEPARRPPLL
jgi:hypothetical protein